VIGTEVSVSLADDDDISREYHSRCGGQHQREHQRPGQADCQSFLLSVMISDNQRKSEAHECGGRHHQSAPQPLQAELVPGMILRSDGGSRAADERQHRGDCE
jgi:hypothetical protein